MVLENLIIGYRCENITCKYLTVEKRSVCPRCHAKGWHPIYDYYRLMNLDPGLSEKDLKATYKKLSLKYHPDINKEGKNIFIAVSEAYQILGNPSMKREYDALVHSLRHPEEERREFFYEEEPVFWQQRKYHHIYENFEEMFRDFHHFHQKNMHLARWSRISGALGAIMGAILGAIFTVGLLSIPGAVFGYFLGRLNPHMAPLLIRIMNLVVVTMGIIVGFGFLITRKLPLVLLIMVTMYFYFSISRSWKRELDSS